MQWDPNLQFPQSRWQGSYLLLEARIGGFYNVASWLFYEEKQGLGNYGA